MSPVTYSHCWSHVAILVAAFLASGEGTTLLAQGVTTGAIGGAVRDPRGQPIEAAQIQVTNRATGFSTGAISRGNGRYLIQGLEVGGPYAVTVRRIGFTILTRDSLTVSLGQSLEVDFTLEPQAAELAGVVVEAEEDPIFSASHTGAASTVADSTLRRLPTLDRTLREFAYLTPQVLTNWMDEPSGGGVSIRFNNLQIDGASEAELFFANQAELRPISLEAVKEYQILLSPYGVRHGSFAGALLNAVTKSGTNDWHGTAVYDTRNERLARDVPYIRDFPYKQTQYAFSLGGPIVRDRLHFFAAADFERFDAPAIGPYVGQSATSETPLPVDTGDIGRFARILEGYGLEPGSAGQFTEHRPASNAFGRLDLALPEWNSRLVLRHNFYRTEGHFAPGRDDFFFGLSSVGLDQVITKHATVGQLYTNFRSGAYNELFVGRTSLRSTQTPATRQPLVGVEVPHASGSGSVILAAGANQVLQATDEPILEVTDNFAFPVGAHRLTVGAHGEWYPVRRLESFGQFGSWTFASLDSLEQGLPYLYEVGKDLGGADATLRAAVYALYAEDVWQLTDRLTLTYGLRADVPVIRNRPPYNPAVDSIFGRRTDEVPSTRVQWAPRLGFNWALDEERRHQLRGGVGVFVGRAHMGRLHNAFANYGFGVGFLTCGDDASAAGPVPAFEPTAPEPPVTCANGAGFATDVQGPVNLLNENLRFPQTFRASVAYDRRLPWDVALTLEGLYTKIQHDFFYVNRNLAGPIGVDRRGRVLYGTLDLEGNATPNLVSPRFSQVIAAEDASNGYSWNLTAQLEKRFSDRLEAKAAYTFSRVRDVQTHCCSFAFLNWAFGRQFAGLQEDEGLGISEYDQPHRVVLTASYRLPWRKWATDLSLVYLGQTGFPYTYTYFGDLNADGAGFYDPIYVPRSAFDTTEIRFAGTDKEVAEQQAAFERFIEGEECLRRQRGRIMARNSCREPWVNALNFSLRQSLPSIGGHTLSLQLDIFNVLNLLNKDWGKVQHVPGFDPSILQHVGQTSEDPLEAHGIFAFDPSRERYTSENLESNYQIQLGARYSF